MKIRISKININELQELSQESKNTSKNEDSLQNIELNLSKREESKEFFEEVEEINIQSNLTNSNIFLDENNNSIWV